MIDSLLQEIAGSIGLTTSLSLALPFVLSAVILAFVLRSVAPVSGFLYANARIQARHAYMVHDKLMEELIKSKNLEEFRIGLKDTSFALELEKAKLDLRSIHTHLEKGFIESMNELIRLSPPSAKQVLYAHMMFTEAKMIRIIYRAKHNSAEVPEGLIYPIGNLNENLIKHLLEAKSTADMGVVMEPTVYAPAFINKHEQLENFEAALDRFVFSHFIHTLEKTKMPDQAFIIQTIQEKTDILNVMAILKMRIRGVDKSRQMDYLIDNGSDLSNKLEALISSGSLKEFVEAFDAHPMLEPMKAGLEGYDKDGSLLHFEISLQRWQKMRLSDQEIGHSLGPFPLIAFLLRKELEVRNLFIISRGIDLNYGRERIMELII